MEREMCISSVIPTNNFSFVFSALQLADDAIHLSLSPTRMSPSNNLNNNNAISLSDITTGTDASKLHKYNNGTAVLKKELSAGDVTNSYGLTFQGIAGGSGMAKTNILLMG